MGCVGDDTVVALVSGDLSPSRGDEVRAHLDDCEACRELVAHTAHALIPTVDERPHRDPALEATEPSLDHAGLDTAELGPGATLGRYRIGRRLGAGAMGVVYAAEHLDLRRSVALKVVRADPDGDSDEQQLRARLLREARAASAVRHPHVVTVHDVLELDDGSPVMVMDLLDGESLRQRLDRGRLGVAEAVTLADQLLSALEAAHEVGVIHRDLKPDNVFLARTDDGDIDARILDFGIAKLTAVDGPAAQTAGLTMTGMLVGTPHYMAPEQAFADPSLDARVDLWAVGVIVYEAVSGRRPIEGDNLGQLFRKLATLAIPPLSEVHADVPPAFADWVHRLLVDRDQRLADATTARRTLATASRRPIELHDSVAPVALGDSADGLVSPRAEPKRRPRTMAVAMALAVASVVVASSVRSSISAAPLSVGLAASWDGLPVPTAATPDRRADEDPNVPAPPASAHATTHAVAAPLPDPSTKPRVAPRIEPAPVVAPSGSVAPRASEPAPASNDGPGKLLTKPPF